MQNQETHQNVTETVLARADAWLADAGETGYTLGACTRKEDSWYAVEVDGGEMPDYRVFVRLTETGSEVRDDRVLDALSREMTGLAAETAPEEALCAAFVSFGSGMPEQVWPRTASLEQVAAATLLPFRITAPSWSGVFFSKILIRSPELMIPSMAMPVFSMSARDSFLSSTIRAPVFCLPISKVAFTI